MPRSEQLIRTKFFIPQLTGDHVNRTSLADKLSTIGDYDLTLVSATAGYGKSTLIASWLRQQSIGASWLSLDENDNDFFLFLKYFIGAIREFNESFGNELIQLVESSQPPTSDYITGKLMNDLAALKDPFVLVLDDFHFISKRNILDLVERLVKHPVPGMRLILISRSDPNLPLYRLRLRGKLLEIRTRDLFLEYEEVNMLLRERFGADPSEGLVNAILKFTEGWISGLKILIKSVEDFRELETLIENQSGTDFFQVGYYLESYLNSLPGTIRKKMLAASLFREFTAELCHYVCSGGDTTDHVDVGSDFIHKLSSDGMFLIPLDASSNWFRYHHFFRDFLTRELQKVISGGELLTMHGRASHWFESKGFIEKAIRHAIRAEDEGRALELFSIYRIRLLTNRQWKEHESLLKLFSEKNRAHQPVLLISRAWVYIYHGKMNEAFTLLSSIDVEIDESTLNSSQRSNLEGELNTIHAYAAYYKGDGDLAVQKSQLAIELLDPGNIYPLGLAWIFLGGGYQMLGKTDAIVPLLYENLESVRHDHVRSGILHVICYIHWLNGNLEDLKGTALQLIELGIHSNNYESRTYGHVFAGHYYYQTDQLESAKEHYMQAYEYRFHILGSVRIHAVIGLIMTRFQLGDIDGAFGLLEELEINAASSGNAYMNMLATLARAELEFRSGNHERAFQLTQNIGKIPPRPHTNFFAPELCISKIWIYHGIPACTGEVDAILDGMERHLKKVNNRRFIIDVFALKSLLLYDQGHQEDSFKFIGKALRLARAGGFLRVFRDMGEKMKELLLATPHSAPEDAFIGQILSTFKVKKEGVPSVELSDREHQILNFLTNKLSNKEIGAKLFITEKTVKNHLNSIYRKLGASGRREAMDKARQWMLL